MQFYLAPLEGVTGHVFREAYDRIFGDIDKYFTPFLPGNDHLNDRNKRELQTLSLHAPLVPQILGNHAAQVLSLAKEINKQGDFDEINLNFGCPSGTVTGKGRGAGILKDLIALDDFLDRIFASCPLRVSVKTRIGWADVSEWEKIVRIFADYPFSEIIIHPRVRADQYRGACKTEAFAYALSRLNVPLCYNGDIDSVESYNELCKLFPTLDRVMIGRGIVKDPFLIGDIRSGILHQEPAPSHDAARLHAFVSMLEEGYLKEMDREEHAVMLMKEFWLYFGQSIPGHEQAKKAIKKAKRMQDYRLATAQIPY